MTTNNRPRTLHRALSASRAFLRGLRSENGATIVLMAGGLVAVMGLVGLSIDTGTVFQERRDLQNAADAAALAGVAQLPDNPGQAVADARAWATRNGIASGDIEQVTVYTSQSANDSILVSIRTNQPLVFGPIFGKDGASVQADAVAMAGSMVGGDGIVPFGVVPTGPCFSGGAPRLGVSCTMKFGVEGKEQGDFGPLSLDGSGASTYRGNIARGSSNKYRIGDSVPTETGNMVGPTKQGLDDRLTRAGGCGSDSFNDVFDLAPDGSYSLRCPTSPRVVIVPIVDKLDNPNPSIIIDFALFYIEDFRFNGGHSEVTGILVDASVSDPAAIFGSFRDNGLRIVKLVQ